MSASLYRPDIEPRAWIGCLACYNHGDLVGDWYAAAEAADVTVEGLHAGSGIDHRVRGCEEMWVFDHEHIPVRGEMDPLRAAAWGARIAEVPECQRPAFLAWVRTGMHVVDADDLPVISDFEERYCGEWINFRDYSDHLVDELGILDGASEEAARYFDYDSFADDLIHDYTTATCGDGGGVYVFRNL
ncbi:antirestriction protein ArdA [Corynebacterium freneyi]|uniref:antirestriction protein ArdA n=1 Tax=Corynebacterium freneyi TaxID=134034 RepID=UPI00254E0931|nr:antirestriction protein ArdA [Corynebacterium freneyi]MDK8768961.1 antirestriction protein ArdA [Corynebacterium freneyi]